MQLIPAKPTDMPFLRRIFEEARLFQRSLGFRQWEDGYPAEDSLLEDMRLERGFLLCDKELSNEPLGYAAIALDGDEEYERLSTIWQLQGQYGVVHRLALGNKGRGRHLSEPLFDLMENHIKEKGRPIVRIDTGTANVVMQRILAKRGYTNLGTHQFVWGERLAYEKGLQ